MSRPLARHDAVPVISAVAAIASLTLLGACSDRVDQNADRGMWQTKGLSSASAFLAIEEPEPRARALFNEMAKVLEHPRCANCHPVAGGPRQGDEHHPHNPPVGRGIGGTGPNGMPCTTCHGTENVTFTSMDGSVPGAIPWRLAPASMGWLGKSRRQLCLQIQDRTRNGDRSLEDLIRHHSTDHLVHWAWNPGTGRTPAPGTQEVFGELTAAWVDAGAHCPE